MEEIEKMWIHSRPANSLPWSQICCQPCFDQGCKILACPWKLPPSTSLTHGHSPSLTVIFHVNIRPCLSIAAQSQHKEANNDPCTYSHKISIKFTTLGRGRKLENVKVNPGVQTPHRETLSQKWTHAQGSMFCNGKWNRAKTRALWDTRGACIAKRSKEHQVVNSSVVPVPIPGLILGPNTAYCK